MKKLFAICAAISILSSCAVTNESGITKSQIRNEIKLAEQVKIEKAVESRQYIVKLDRMYFNRGGMAELIPRRNYIIIDGEKAIIKTAYIGRQFDIRPIAGINIHGLANNYTSSVKASKGLYEVKLQVNNGSTSFDLYLTISKSGICTASLTGSKIDLVRYKGLVVPIETKTGIEPRKGIMI